MAPLRNTEGRHKQQQMGTLGNTKKVQGIIRACTVPMDCTNILIHQVEERLRCRNGGMAMLVKDGAITFSCCMVSVGTLI